MDGNMSDKAEKLFKEFRDARLAEEKEREVWKDCFNAVNNWTDGELGQWKSAWRQLMGDRPMLSLNYVRKFMNRICGAQRLTKMDEKVIPRDDDSDPIVAEILNDLRKFVYDFNDAELVHIARAFRDMIICGRGFIKAEWTDEREVLGEIGMKRINPFRVYLKGKGERYDLLDRKGICEVLPMDKDELLNLFPDSKDDIEGMDIDDEEVKTASEEDYGGDGEDVFDREQNKYVVVRHQQYEWIETKFLPGENGELIPVDVKLPEGVKPISKKIRKVRVYYTLGDKNPQEEDSKYKHGRFDMVPFFAYMDDGKITGTGQDLLDPQKEINKRRSEALYLFAIASKGNFFAKKGAVDDLDDVQKRIGGYGQIIEVNGQPSEALFPIRPDLSVIPALIGMEQMAAQDMKEISGLQDASLGEMPTGAKSGRAIQELQQPAETMIGELFDNYVFSRKLLAQMVISLIQQFYTEPKRIRIAGDYSSRFLTPEMAEMRKQLESQVLMANPMMSPEEAGMQTNQLLQMNDGTKIIGINIMVGNKRLNDVSVGKYDVVVDHVAQNPTTRRAQYYDLLNLVSMGIPVPPRHLIGATDMRNKEQLIADIEQAQQQALMQGMAQEQAKGGTPSQSTPQPFDIMLNSAGAQTPQL